MPDFIIYLEMDQMYYLGSTIDDSCVVQISFCQSKITIVRAFSNLGSLTDFCLLEQQEKVQLYVHTTVIDNNSP